MKPPSSMAMEPQIGAPILTRWRRRFLTWEKKYRYWNSWRRSHTSTASADQCRTFLSSPESQVPPKDPIRLSKDSLWRFGAIETQRHNPTFFGSKICLTHLCPLSAWEWTALSHPKIYPDTDCLPFQRWIVSIFFCLSSLLSWLLTKRVNSICAWLTAACWKFQEQVKSVAPRASHQERVARRII